MTELVRRRTLERRDRRERREWRERRTHWSRSGVTGITGSSTGSWSRIVESSQRIDATNGSPFGYEARG